MTNTIRINGAVYTEDDILRIWWIKVMAKNGRAA